MEKNREIKFSYILQHEETGMIHEQIFDYLAIFSGACRDHILRMNRYIVVAKRQFTGLLDKNGKEIYEGDTCNVTYYNHSHPDTNIIQEVVFENGTFCLKSKLANNLELKLEDTRQFVPLYYCLAPNKIEIIGNIYEPHQ